MCLGCKRKNLLLGFVRRFANQGLVVWGYIGAGTFERYRSAAPSSGVGEKEAQAETSCAVSQLFLHGELEMPFCLRLFVFFLLSVVFFSSTDFRVERSITQTQSQEPSVFFLLVFIYFRLSLV